MVQSKADVALQTVYTKLAIAGAGPHTIYARVADVVGELDILNTSVKFQPATTGTISERLCGLGLEVVRQSRPLEYKRLSTNWKWLGDYVVAGNPYDITISVKSFKARERLLASGTGSVLAPTIGWGLFNSKEEWSEVRVRAHLYRGFVAIYMPPGLLGGLSLGAKGISNINGRPLLRPLADFPLDLVRAISASTNRVQMQLL